MRFTAAQEANLDFPTRALGGEQPMEAVGTGDACTVELSVCITLSIRRPESVRSERSSALTITAVTVA